VESALPSQAVDLRKPSEDVQILRFSKLVPLEMDWKIRKIYQ
jgi:hypothetical protein